jgi:hypothetical protein
MIDDELAEERHSRRVLQREQSCSELLFERSVDNKTAIARLRPHKFFDLFHSISALSQLIA